MFLFKYRLPQKRYPQSDAFGCGRLRGRSPGAFVLFFGRPWDKDPSGTRITLYSRKMIGLAEQKK